MSETPATPPQDETFGSVEINGATYRTVTVKLSRAMPLGGAVVTEITMREPTAQDLLAADEEAGERGGGFRRSVAILSRTAQLPSTEIGKLAAVDFLALDRRLNRFLASGQ